MEALHVLMAPQTEQARKQLVQGLVSRRSGERECFALLLEYVECPEEPRPVHGDPCVSTATACEMSRVRETVRLRLVPPRDFRPEGPTPKFLRALCEGRKAEERCSPDPREREPFPCLTDPCCVEKPLFPCTIPWAHENPFNPGQPAGPKVIGLAVMYSLLAGQIASADSDENEVSSKVRVAAELYRMTARLLDRKFDEPNELERVTIAVQQLLSDWCCSFLYPGPCCEGEPHGVVIGCAVVCGGEIKRIDPWGGRRWVMHYPLLSYWGEQFGILPPDALASRIFGLICCLARLERPSCEDFYRERGAAEGMEMSFGRVRLGIGPGNAAAGRRRTARRETVSLLEFAARALAAMAQGQAPEGTPLLEVRLEGNSDVYLLVPDPAALEPRPPVEARVSGDEWLRVLVHEALAVTRIRRAHRSRPLLRVFAERLSIGLAASVPLSALTRPPPQELAEALEGAGIDTVGALLEQTPESLAANVGDAVTPQTLSDLILRSEARIQAVTEATVESVQSVAGERGPVSAVDFSASAEARRALFETLARGLQLPTETVEQRVSEALA
jgi:hypothetical protein